MKDNWELLDTKWQSKLLTNSFIKNKNNKKTIDYALIDSGLNLTSAKLHKLVASYIRDMYINDFYSLINEICIGKNVKNKRDFIKEIKQFPFNGNYSTLNLLSHAIGIDFLVFFQDSLEIMNISDNIHNKLLIILFDKSTRQFHSIGLKINDKLKTIFKKDSLPHEISLLLDKKEFYLAHINKTSEICFTLNDIIYSLQEIFGKKFTIEDRKFIISLLHTPT